MSQPVSPLRARQMLRDEAEQFIENVLSWSETHPSATLSEMENRMREHRRHFMRRVIEVAVSERGSGYAPEGVLCPDCSAPMVFKGDLPRTIETREATTLLKRAYYYCDQCGNSLFPPGSGAATSSDGSVEPDRSLGGG